MESEYDNFKCFCGKPSIRIDTWFKWYPCEDHITLSPIEYQEEKLKWEKEHGK